MRSSTLTSALQLGIQPSLVVPAYTYMTSAQPGSQRQAMQGYLQFADWLAFTLTEDHI